MIFFAVFVPVAVSACSLTCSLMYYLDRDTCSCTRCGTGSCKGGEFYLPQVCETEDSEDSGCRACGELNCAGEENYMKEYCSPWSSGCMRPKWYSGESCQLYCGKQAPSKCWCDHICSDFDDCCEDYNDFCIWGHNCPTLEAMTQTEIDDGGCDPAWEILVSGQWHTHTKCSNSTLEVGDWCESDGECGYSADIDNCNTTYDRNPVDIYVVRAKAISSCVDDGTITCNPGEYIDTERYCNGTECTSLDVQCCNIPDQCLNADYLVCPYHQFWKIDNGVTCSTKRCQIEECCEDKASCEEAEGLINCPGHKFVDFTLYCSDDVCDSGDDEECCATREYCNNTNLTCNDQENYFLDVDIPEQCAERCVDGECCVERLSCANNSLLTCNSTTFLDIRLNCATDECLITDTQCCGTKANCDESVICSSHTFSDPNFFCATDVCQLSDDSNCCQPKAYCVDDGTITCDSAFFIDTNLQCATDSCNSTDTQCCTPRTSCDDTVDCNKGEFSDPNILCATDICNASESYCCQPQASCNEEVNCGLYYYPNETLYCSTSTCTPDDSHCCESCNKHIEVYPLEGVCPNAEAPKDGSAQMCEDENLDLQHRFEVAISNQLYHSCSSWCVYDLYSNGEIAFIWKANRGDNGCWIDVTWGTCFEANDRNYILENKIAYLCPPEPYDACTPMDRDNNCQIVWDVDPVENPVAFNRLTKCHCPNPLYWGFRDWYASTAVLCHDEGKGLDTRLHMALANHAWGFCVNWCIYDVWEPETYVWMWNMVDQCYKQRYIDVNTEHICAGIIFRQEVLDEYNVVMNYTSRYCDVKDTEWALGSSGQSCSNRCGELNRSCDGEITSTVNFEMSKSQVAVYFSKVGVTCADYLEGDNSISGETGYYPDSGNCVLISNASGISFRQHCEISPTIASFQRLCACVKAPNKPSPY